MRTLILLSFLLAGCASKVVVKNCKPGVPFKVLAEVETLDLDTADFICEEL